MTDEEFLTKSNALYMEAFPHSELLPGVERLIRHLVAHNIPIGKNDYFYKLNTILTFHRYRYRFFP